MNYSQSLQFLNSFLNLERIVYHPKNRDWNLHRMRILLKWFGHPEKHFFPILIAGTKGKGSTGFFLESILRENRIPVGFYCSPHLEEPRERIRISGKMISKKKWIQGLRLIQNVLAKRRLPASLGDFTYFEVMTLLGILTFACEGVRIGIFEIGMGGRLDATNCLDPKLVILTPVHLDHEAFLGSTLAKIAGEKAAIIRQDCDVILSPQQREAREAIQGIVRKRRACLWPVSPVSGFRIGLKGDYQQVNAGAALQAAQVLRDRCGYSIHERGIRRGLQANQWPGRFEMIHGSPDFLLDGAHNPSSIKTLVSNLKQSYPKRDRLLIFGVSRDKKAEPMLKALCSVFRQVIITPISNPRSQEMAYLLDLSRKYFEEVYPARSVLEALTVAWMIGDTKTLVVGTGSFYLIGELRKLLCKRQIPPVFKNTLVKVQ